jgi:ankyrin repeat protein
MSFQISGFVQFFQNLFESTPPQPLAVPQRGAPLDEIRRFVDSLHLPPDLHSRLVDAHLRGFAKFFRMRGIDPNDEGACARFTKEFLDYFYRKPSPEFLNGRNPQGMTPLMCALKEEDFDVVMDLRQHGAIIDGELLTFAIRNNASDKFLKYFFRYADIQVRDGNAMRQLFDSICLMAERGRCFGKYLRRPPWSEEPLVHQAVSCGHTAVIPILKDAGFHLDGFVAEDWQTGFTPLMSAICKRTPDRAVIETLLEAGASALLENGVGDSPLTLAYACRRKDIALLLIRHGAQATPEIETWISKHEDQLN